MSLRTDKSVKSENRPVYAYSNLDLVKVTDRLGNVTSYVYDNMERKIYETNGNRCN